MREATNVDVDLLATHQRTEDLREHVDSADVGRRGKGRELVLVQVGDGEARLLRGKEKRVRLGGEGNVPYDVEMM